MTNVFADALRGGANMTRTENGAATHSTAGSNVLDLFASGGAWRSRSEEDIAKAVELAFCEDPLLTLRCLFYLRDARGGQGERRTFRVALQHLAKYHAREFHKVLNLVAYFGRWDDLLGVSHIPLVSSFLKSTLENDLKAEKPTLLAKWLPTENTTSEATRHLARRLIKSWGWKTKFYKRSLVALRAKLNVLEPLLCAKRWSEINYEHVPSRASLKYRKAFKKQDEARYTEYIAAVKKGEKKIHASTLYPYDLVSLVRHAAAIDETIEAQWNALPNYLDKPTNALVMCDTSGSMENCTLGSKTKTQPMDVSLSLALYIAERNQGPFHNLYMTFSGAPQIVAVGGNSLFEKVRKFEPIVANTNLMAAFREILNYAKHSGATQDQIPQMLIVISDMEFDSATHFNSPSVYGYGNTAWGTYGTHGQQRVAPQPGETTNFQQAKIEFEAAGYKLPTVVFWNVASRNDQQPVRMHDTGAILVSGASPSILKYVLNPDSEMPKAPTPIELMLQVLTSERYSIINLEG